MKDLRDVSEQAKIAREQALKVRTMKMKRRHVHSHEARSKLHDDLVTGLSDLQLRDDDGGGEVDEKSQEEKEHEKLNERRVKDAEERTKSLQDLQNKMEEKGGGGGSFKPRTITRRGAPPAPETPGTGAPPAKEGSSGNLDISEHRNSQRPSLLGAKGGGICTCQNNPKTTPCRVHPFG